MLMEATNPMTFGERLAYARKKKGLNQKQLAKLIGVTQSIISRWENGIQKPYLSTKTQKLIKVLEVSGDWLIGNDNFKMSQQDIRLTKEQQQFVADNEWLIRYMFYKKFRYLRTTYEYYYGYAAIGLCKAAIAYDKTKGSFFSLAYLRIKSEITHALESERKDIQPLLSLNTPINDENEPDEIESIIPAPDKWEELEYKILVESVYQKVEHVLTAKEKESLKLCLYGMTNKEISKKLGIGYDTTTKRISGAKKKCKELINPNEIFA